jgi:hypothetical protein
MAIRTGAEEATSRWPDDFISGERIEVQSEAAE